MGRPVWGTTRALCNQYNYLSRRGNAWWCGTEIAIMVSVGNLPANWQGKETFCFSFNLLFFFLIIAPISLVMSRSQEIVTHGGCAYLIGGVFPWLPPGHVNVTTTGRRSGGSSEGSLWLLLWSEMFWVKIKVNLKCNSIFFRMFYVFNIPKPGFEGFCIKQTNCLEVRY